MYQVRLLDEAVMEATEAAAWYERECPGLGIEFNEALEAALDLLEDEIVPLTTMPGEPGLHGFKRLVLSRFPFDIVVLPGESELLVVAVVHHSRSPGYWLAK
jgi:toxin ParE1/3/4